MIVVEDYGSEPPMISLIEDQVDTEGALEELEAAMAAASATPPLTNPEPSTLTADAKLKQTLSGLPTPSATPSTLSPSIIGPISYSYYCLCFELVVCGEVSSMQFNLILQDAFTFDGLSVQLHGERMDHQR